MPLPVNRYCFINNWAYRLPVQGRDSQNTNVFVTRPVHWYPVYRNNIVLPVLKLSVLAHAPQHYQRCHTVYRDTDILSTELSVFLESGIPLAVTTFHFTILVNWYFSFDNRAYKQYQPVKKLLKALNKGSRALFTCDREVFGFRPETYMNVSPIIFLHSFLPVLMLD